MITLKYSTHCVAARGKTYSVATVDSCTDWDAETRGEEPGYALFTSFLAHLLAALGRGNRVYGSFTERRTLKSGLSQLPDVAHRLVRFPIFLPEQWVSSILGRLSPRLARGYGSGIALEVACPGHIREMLASEKRPHEWVFFVVDPQGRPDWLALRPWYLLEHGFEPTDPEVVASARCAVYHEACTNYCEVLTAGLDDPTLYTAIASSADQAGLHVDRATEERE